MKQNKFFLLSILPAIAYWYLESKYSVKVALIGGVSLSLIEMLLEKIFIGHVHKISKLNFFLIAFLGSLSLFNEDGIWFKLQPFFTGVVMGGFLLYKNIKNDSILLSLTKEMNPGQMPDTIVLWMERNTSIFMMCYGVFMFVVAFYATTSKWLFFKTVGFYIAFFIFFILQMLYLRRKR